jgi:hypothetical protein
LLAGDDVLVDFREGGPSVYVLDFGKQLTLQQGKMDAVL